MAFRISQFNPFAGRKKKIVVEPEDGNPMTFYMEWTKAPVLRSRNGENYFLSSQQLPPTDLSGPLPYNARPIRIARPAPPIDTRQIPTGTIGGAGLLNGQVISQPIFNAEKGGYGVALEPLNPLPFERVTILPAGASQ